MIMTKEIEQMILFVNTMLRKQRFRKIFTLVNVLTEKVTVSAAFAWTEAVRGKKRRAGQMHASSETRMTRDMQGAPKMSFFLSREN